jgi:hypothetical protein
MDARTRNLEAPFICFNCLVNNSRLSTPKITFIGYMIWGSGDHTWWPTNPSPCHQHFLVLEFGFYSKSREFRLQEFVSTRWVFYVFIHWKLWGAADTETERVLYMVQLSPSHNWQSKKKKRYRSLWSVVALCCFETWVRLGTFCYN